MTIKFFPLYFMVDCGASPATVQGIYVGVPLAMLAGGALNGRLAGPAWGLGRVQTIVLFKGLGVASAIIIASCIKENGMLKELKCTARPKSVCFCVSAR